MKFKVIYDRISTADCAFFSLRQQFGMALFETKAGHMIAVASIILYQILNLRRLILCCMYLCTQ